MNWASFVKEKFEGRLSYAKKNLDEITKLHVNSLLVSADDLEKASQQLTQASLYYVGYEALRNKQLLKQELGLWQRLKFRKELENFDKYLILQKHETLLKGNIKTMEAILTNISADGEVAVPGKNVTQIMPVDWLRGAPQNNLEYSAVLLDVLRYNLKARLEVVRHHEVAYGKIPEKGSFDKHPDEVLEAFVARALLHKYVAPLAVGKLAPDHYAQLVPEITASVKSLLKSIGQESDFEAAKAYVIRAIEA